MATKESNSEDNLFTSLLYKYLPFWPLFAALLVISVLGAWVYLHYFAIPIYNTTATLIIKDQNKGVDESRMTQSIDAFISNDIVENEIKVMHSRALMRQVVKDLMLYAPVYEDDKFKSVLAYTSSPVRIKLKKPESLVEHEKVFFTYNQIDNKIKINNNTYPLNKWVNTPFGEIQFLKNERKNHEAAYPLYFSIIEPKKAIDELLESLNIAADNKLSTVVNLQFYDPVPERGEDILNSLIEAYGQVAVVKRNKLASNTLKFVEDRIKLVEQELGKLEKKVEQYKSSEGVVDLSQQGKLFLENVGNNDRKISDINIQLTVLDNIEKYVISKNNAAGIVPSTLGINDQVLTQLLQKLYDSEILYQKLSKTTAENNPIILTVADEIEKIRPSILEHIRNHRLALVASRTNLGSNNGQYNVALQNIPRKEKELLEISRQQAIKNEAYSFLLQKREETVLSYAPTSEDTKIVDIAEASILPISPQAIQIYLIAIFISFISGFVIVSAQEIFNGKVLFRSEIEHLTKTPIVGEVSFVNTQKNELFKKPSEIFLIEQFRQLRATLGFYGRTFTKKKIIVTSSIPGEGKSFVSSNIAYSLAASRKKVALVDFDLRNPNASKQFNLYQRRGLTEYLGEEAELKDIIYDTAFNNLSIVPAGINIGDNTELFLNGKLEIFFTYLDKEFDYVIIDTPPLDLISDAYLLSEYCDITLLVMRHAYTPKTIVQRLNQSNKLKSLQKVGIVFNGVKPRGFVKKEFGYGYGYGYDNRYSEKAYHTRSI